MLRRVTSSGIVLVVICLWCIMWWTCYKVLIANDILVILNGICFILNDIFVILNDIFVILNDIFVIIIDIYNSMS